MCIEGKKSNSKLFIHNAQSCTKNIKQFIIAVNFKKEKGKPRNGIKPGHKNIVCYIASGLT